MSTKEVQIQVRNDLAKGCFEENSTFHTRLMHLVSVRKSQKLPWNGFKLSRKTHLVFWEDAYGPVG